MNEGPIAIGEVDVTQTVLMVCMCEKTCKPFYPKLQDINNMNIVLHYVNEEGDVVPVPLDELTTRKHES